MKIAIYGAGCLGQYIYRQINESNKMKKYTVKVWIDNLYSEDTLYGIPIVTEEDFIKKYSVDRVIIAIRDVGTAHKICASLLSNGIDDVYIAKECISDSELEVFNELGEFSQFLNKWDKILPVLPYMETHITDECNLKCRACMHFSNIASNPQNTDLLKFEKSIQGLSNKFFNIQNVRLMGGEPLLNEELPRFIEIVRTYFPLADIRVVTNGLCIMDISPDLIDKMRECVCTFDITQYPPTEKIIDKVINFLDMHRVGYSIEPPNKIFKIRTSTGDTNYEDVFYDGCLSKTCTFFREGRIYVCPHIPMLYKEKWFFGFDISEEEFINNGIEITSNSGWDILKKLSKPFTMCRFCSKEHKSIEWSTGKAKPEDWIV